MKDTELEDGVAILYRNDSSSIDPDISLSYLGERLQDVLGQFQKDFEAGISAENSGPLFGGYGSFLPTYQRNTHSILSHRKTPQGFRNHSTPKSCAAQTSRGPLNIPLPSFEVDEKPSLNHESKAGKQSVKRTLKVRIKMGSDKLKHNCPQPDYNGFKKEDTLIESPTSIVNVMTSFPVPEWQLLSPLQESLLFLMKKEKLPRKRRLVSRELCNSLFSELASQLENGRVFKEKKSKLGTESETMVQMNQEECVNIEKTWKRELSHNIKPPPETTTKLAAHSVNQNSGIGFCGAWNDQKSTTEVVGRHKIKARKIDSQEDKMDALDNLDIEEERDAYFDKLNRRSSGGKVGNQTASEPVLKGNVVNSETAGATIDPMFNSDMTIEDNWVCCDSCEKWRLLPFGTKPEYLPEKWWCSMLNWLPGMNRCDISEDETTRALNELYQIPLLESNHNPQTLSPHAIPSEGKKKAKPKEIPNSVNTGSLNEMEHPRSKSSGNKRSKAEREWESDQYGPEETKKIKIEGSKHMSMDIIACKREISLKKRNQEKTVVRAERSNRTIKGMDSLKRHLGFGQVSTEAANSSSSKVSDFHKSAAEVKEELVSSSPLRNFNAGKHTPVIRKISEKTRAIPSTKSHEFSSLGCGKTKSNIKPSSEIGSCHSVDGALGTHEEKYQYPSNESGANKNHFHDEGLLSLRIRKEERSSNFDFTEKKDKKNHCSKSKFSIRCSRESREDGHSKVDAQGKEKNQFNKKKYEVKSSSCSGELPFEVEKHIVYEKKSAAKWSIQSREMPIFKSEKHDGEENLLDKEKCVIKWSGGRREDTMLESKEQEGKKNVISDSIVTSSTDHIEVAQFKSEEHICSTVLGASYGISGNLGPQLKPIEDKEVELSRHFIAEKNKRVQLDASSRGLQHPLEKDAVNVLREAAEHRGYADYLKRLAFDFESNEEYLQAALKFLLGASLLETCNPERNINGDMNPLQIYCTTAKILETCAHEYERRHEMAAAALAFKCMEVAYMKIIYYNNSIISRDRHELETTLLAVHPGGSSSSSASCVDHLSNPAAIDKGTSGNPVIASRNRPTLVRLINFTQDVHLAMEASRKSQEAFAAASSNSEEGISSLRKVINFSFQDVDELLQLIPLARETIIRQSFCKKQN